MKMDLSADFGATTPGLAASGAAARHEVRLVAPERVAVADRALYAVEPAVLRRAMGDALCDEGARPGGLSAVGRTLAAFAGCARPVEGAEPLPVERLVHQLADEVWFLGSFAAGVAVLVLAHLGADPDAAAALMTGEPLALRLEPPQTPHAVRTFPASVSVLDGTRAGEWRLMLRSAGQSFEAADPSLRAEVAAAVGLSRTADVDRYVFTLLAALAAVVDFAEDGHDVLVAGAQ